MSQSREPYLARIRPVFGPVFGIDKAEPNSLKAINAIGYKMRLQKYGLEEEEALRAHQRSWEYKVNCTKIVS
jgi:hypothetical protein